MPIAADRQRYFWLEANDAVTATEPEPATYENSRITPCIDLFEYMQKFQEAIALVGVDPNPANNRGDFIYIAGWWLGLLGGQFVRNRAFEGPSIGLGSAGPSVGDITAFDLDPLAPELRLIEVLKEKARIGVEVRVLGWVSFSLLSTTLVPIPLLGTLIINPIVANVIQSRDPGGMVSLNAQTLNAIKNLRAEPNIAKGGMLNVIGHSAGAVHIKGAIVGSKPDNMGKSKAIAFTGGLDMVEDRWAKFGHKKEAGWDALPPLPVWHDVEAAIEGPAAQGFYNHFKDMWNENLRRDAKRFNFEGEQMLSYVAGTEDIPDRVVDQFLIPSVLPADHHVQSLRTIPAFRYHWYNCMPENPPVSYASNGLFEIKAAWRKAILGAQTYVYIEDQMYWGREVMEWVNQAIRNNPGLKVIMALSGSSDPNDPPTPGEAEYMHDSFNIGLLGIDTANELNAAQRNRIRLFRIWGESYASSDTMILTTITPVSPTQVNALTNVVLGAESAPVPEDALAARGMFVTAGGVFWAVTGNLALAPGSPFVLKLDPHGAPPANGTVVNIANTYGLFVHSKVTLIDDKWALIGSANVARRSLYTDWEHSIAFLDTMETDVAHFRARLWAEHFKKLLDFDVIDFLDLAEALGAWEPAWKTTPTVPSMPTRPAGDIGPPYLQLVTLPLPVHPMTDKTRTARDAVRDMDSRENWGGICPPSS
jgi:phosphatidylserine/phosphatidylglycerophosphate/cardiolipin synthase-like enzyme